MKKILSVLFLLITVSSVAKEKETSSDRPLGVGIILGLPTGFTARKSIADKNSIHGGLAFGFNHYMHVWGDYVWDFHDLGIKDKDLNENLKLYAGIGGGAVFGLGTLASSWGGFAGVVRAPVGIELSPKKIPFSFFLEVGLGLIAGNFGIGMDGFAALGGVYRF